MGKLANLIFWIIPVCCYAVQAEQQHPVYIGLDTEFGYKDSTPAEAIEEQRRRVERTSVATIKRANMAKREIPQQLADLADTQEIQ